MVIVKKKKSPYENRNLKYYNVDGSQMYVKQNGSVRVVGSRINSKKVFLRRAGLLVNATTPKGAQFEMYGYEALSGTPEKRVKFRSIGFRKKRR